MSTVPIGLYDRLACESRGHDSVTQEDPSSPKLNLQGRFREAECNVLNWNLARTQSLTPLPHLFKELWYFYSRKR